MAGLAGERDCPVGCHSVMRGDCGANPVSPGGYSGFGDQESWAIRDRVRDKLVLPEGISDFQQSVWMARFGIADHDAGNVIEKCDATVCSVRIAGRQVIIANDLANPFYACRHGDMIISLKRDMPRDICAPDVTVIDDDLLWWQGASRLRCGPMLPR